MRAESKLNYPFYLSLLCVSLCGMATLIFLKKSNLAFYSEELPHLVPLTDWMKASGLGILLFLTCFFIECFAFLFGIAKQKKEKFIIINGLTYLIPASILLGVSIPVSFGIFVSAKIVLLFVFREKQTGHLSKAKVHLFAFAIILASQVFFNDFVSPFAWSNSIASLNKNESTYIGPASTAILFDYKNAKKFDFSSYDHSFWGAMPYSPTSGNSTLIQVLANLFDLPVNSYESQSRILLIVMFFVCLIGSFGFYCFLHFGLELSSFVSLLGGVSFVVSNTFLAEQFTNHFPMFAIPFLILPWILLLFRMAYRTGSAVLAFASGLLFSLHFYIFFSHPDTIAHATLFWIGFLFFQILFDRKQKLSVGFKFILLSGLGYGLGSFYKISPVLNFILLHESQVFGHTTLVHIFYGLKDAPKIVLLPMLWLGLLAPLCLHPETLSYAKKHKPKDFIFFLFSFVFLFLLFYPGYDGPFIQLLQHFKVATLSFKQVSRVLMYMELSGLIVALFAVEWLFARAALFERLSLKVLCFLWMSLLIIYTVKKWAVFSPYLAGAFVLFCLLYYFASKFEKNKIKPFVLCGVLSALTLILLQNSSLEWRGARRNDNPKGCSSYVSLQSLLTMVKFQPEDKKNNERLLYDRLMSYARDAKSTLSVEPANALALSRSLFPAIDQFYLKEYSCIYPKLVSPKYSSFDWAGMFYNLTGLYYSHDNRFDRVLSATKDNVFAGLTPGLFLQDANQSIDVRMLRVYPPVNALYILPGEYYSQVGSYDFIKRWQSQGSEVFSDARIRKTYNVAGIKLFTLRKDDFAKLEDKSQLQVVQDVTPESLSTPFVVVKDERAYDTAFLASSIRYISSKRNHFEKYKFPLLDENKFNEYRSDVDCLSDKIQKLENKHAVIVEEDSKEEGSVENASSENGFKILNIFGNKAAFQVQCKKQPCVVTWNTAALSGWKAFANGIPASVRRSNFAFLSSEAPLGESILWFEYDPFIISLGLFLSLFSFFIGALQCFKKHHAAS